MFWLLRKFTIPAYRIKGVGLGGLCEQVRRIAAHVAPATPFITDDFRGRAKFICHLREHMGSQMFFRGSYSGDQLVLLEQLLKPEATFIDIGANQGEFTIAAALIVSQGSVIAFEPVAEYRHRLQDNIDLNAFAHVEVLPYALGDNEGVLPIYDKQTPFADGTRHEGLPTLFASSSRSEVRELVTVRRLDDVLAEMGVDRVDVIKLDIEGAEWAALRGAQRTLEQHRPVLIVEIGWETCQAAGYQPDEFARWIIEQGYYIEKIIEDGKTQAITPDQLGDFQNIFAYPAAK